VWIDPKGVIRAFTSAKEVTEANIRALLEGRPVRMEMKLDNFTFKGDEAPTLTQVYGEYPNGLKYYSAILNYIPGIIAGVSRRNIDSAQNTIRVTRRNISIPHLFANAVGNSMGGDPFESPEFDFGKRVVLDVKDSNRYIYRPGQGMTPEEWRVKNCFTYEAVMPLSQQEKDMFTAMHYELERFFNVTCRIEKRRMKCFSLVRVPDQAKVLQVAKWNVEYPKDTSYLQVKGYTTDRLLERISTANRYTPYVFCDRTGIMNRFDIRIKKSILSDIPGLKQELRKQCNLDLIETEQELEVLVIKENQ
jgi:hypothetical protein